MSQKIAFISVVPSPYQRDLFAVLATRPGVDLRVFYLEDAAPDSPWPEPELNSFETILPGFWLPVGTARCHINWGLPALDQFDMVVMNTLMSFTAQVAMRGALKSRPWMFWGERLQGKSALHRMISAPLHKAAAIVGIGSLATNDYRVRYPEPKHFNIPYFCDLSDFQKSAGRSGHSDEFVFLFCGQMIARKGLDILLNAFTRLVAENKQVRLMLVGREADLLKMLHQVNDPDGVEYQGFQDPNNLPRCFSQADAFVLPSRHDGWGVVINQALGAGLPIICSEAVGAGRELVQNEINGLIVPTGDADALYHAMKRLVEDRALSKAMGAASLELSKSWTPQAGADRWLAAIQETLHRSSETPANAAHAN